MAVRNRLLLALALVTLAMYFWGLGSTPLLSFNEARRAVPVREMLASGDWLIPTLNGQLYISKPPLLYWLAAIPATLFGSTAEWVVRLPSAISAMLVTWLTFLAVRRRFGEIPAVLAVLILATSAGFTMFGRSAEIEMLLTLCCFGSVLAAAEYIFGGQRKHWLNVAFLCLGLGLLTKGPVTLLFYVPPLLMFWWRYRENAALECLTHWRGWLLAMVVGGSWYLLVSLQLGWDVWKEVIKTDIAGKVGHTKSDPLWQYPSWLLVDFLPWCLLALAAPVRNFRRWVSAPPGGFFLLAALVPLVIFSLFADKHAKYLLPTYPAWAVLLALAAADLHGRCSSAARRVFHAVVALLVAGFLVYYAVGQTHALAHRFQALPKIATAVASHPDVAVYGWKDIDPRVVYALGKPVPVLDPKELEARLAKGEALQLLVEDSVPPTLQGRLCRLAVFEPYLKSGRKALLLGSGAACG
ncbi:MAG: glycosyltransferase family 39 protein [Methylophilaceae bacterium]|nr:glycosyltransferase family 39 protein [Methylophilaceae bacterium]